MNLLGWWRRKRRKPMITTNSIREKFERFHEANPGVYNTLVKEALNLRERGFKRFSISLLYERVRWLYLIETRGEGFKLNNNYRSEYARLIMKQVPELKGFFRTRPLTRRV